MPIIGLINLAGLIVSWVVYYQRSGLAEIKAEQGIDWRQFLIPNLPFFLLYWAKMVVWPAVLVYWAVTGFKASPWRATTEIDGIEVRKVLRVAPEVPASQPGPVALPAQPQPAGIATIQSAPVGVNPYQSGNGSTPACPICNEAFSRNTNVMLHALHHVVPAPDGRPGFIWQCRCGLQDGVWDQNYGAAAGLATHFQNQHGIHVM